MKRFLFCCVVLAAIVASCVAIVGCPKYPGVTPPAPPPAADHSITLAWNQSFANNPPCSATITTSCIAGFNEGYLAGGANEVQLHSDSPASCSGTSQPESCTSTFNGTLPIGDVTFYVKTAYKDQDGADGVTAAATSSPVSVGADKAENVTATINN